MPRYCFIDWCKTSSYKNPNQKLIRFPKNTKTFLCDQHFPSNYFGKKKLKESSYEKIQKLLIEKRISIPTEPLPEKTVKNKRKYSRRCVFKHCSVTDISTPAVKFVMFPKENSKLFSIWVEKCDLSKKEQEKVYKYVCEKHFKDMGDEVPNCNLTAEAESINDSEFKSMDNNDTFETDSSNQNIEDFDQTNVISTINVTLIEDFAQRHPIKEEPELLIVDVTQCDEL